MDYATLINLVSDLGFPIACVFGLGYFSFKLVHKMQDEHAKREDKLMVCLDNFGATQKDIVFLLKDIENRLCDIEDKIEKTS